MIVAALRGDCATAGTASEGNLGGGSVSGTPRGVRVNGAGPVPGTASPGICDFSGVSLRKPKINATVASCDSVGSPLERPNQQDAVVEQRQLGSLISCRSGVRVPSPQPIQRGALAPDRPGDDVPQAIAPRMGDASCSSEGHSSAAGAAGRFPALRPDYGSAPNHRAVFPTFSAGTRELAMGVVRATGGRQ